jgi:hypothetical protein
MSDMNIDPNRPFEEILAAIREAAIIGINSNKPAIVTPAFATLLVRLSRDADRVASNVASMTRQLLALTWAILGLTFLLFLSEIFKVTGLLH